MWCRSSLLLYRMLIVFKSPYTNMHLYTWNQVTKCHNRVCGVCHCVPTTLMSVPRVAMDTLTAPLCARYPRRAYKPMTSRRMDTPMAASTTTITTTMISSRRLTFCPTFRKTTRRRILESLQMSTSRISSKRLISYQRSRQANRSRISDLPTTSKVFLSQFVHLVYGPIRRTEDERFFGAQRSSAFDVHAPHLPRLPHITNSPGSSARGL